MKKALRFLQKDPVLSVAALAAALSMLLTPPDGGYFDYLNLRVLALLFCLMAVVAGLQRIGALARLSDGLAARLRAPRALALGMVLLCFFLSAVLTNDVALLAFVPFTLALPPARDGKWLLRTVVLETVAANLGSLGTPVGNPQNLFLYTHYSMGSGDFFRSVLPLWGLSLALVAALTLRLCRGAGEAGPAAVPAARGTQVRGRAQPLGDPSAAVPAVRGAGPAAMPAERGTQVRGRAQPLGDSSAAVPAERGTAAPLPAGRLAEYAALFGFCLLTVFGALDWRLCLAAVTATLLLCDRALFARVDYALLLTFVCFFIFVGNLGRCAPVAAWLSGLLRGRERLVSALVSQVVSNVPAAAMLAPFTDNARGLLLGTNIGGLGTPVASMASLISYKLYCAGPAPQKGRYLAFFSAVNFALLVLLLLVCR